MALSAIDFMEYEVEEPFEESHLYQKCRNMLFMAYLLELNKERIDSEIKYVRLFELDKIVQVDFQQKVKKGLEFSLVLDKKGNPTVRNNIQGKRFGQMGLINLHVRDIVYDLAAEHISAVTTEAKNS